MPAPQISNGAELSSLKVANTNLQLQLKADQSAMAALGESVKDYSASTHALSRPFQTAFRETDGHQHASYLIFAR